MGLFRILSVLLLVVATSLSGWMAAAHGDGPSGKIEMGPAQDMAHDHTHCCEDGADRSSSCHILAALIPASVSAQDALAPARTVIFARSTRLVGTEPSGPLDPPRSV